MLSPVTCKTIIGSICNITRFKPAVGTAEGFRLFPVKSSIHIALYPSIISIMPYIKIVNKHIVTRKTTLNMYVTVNKKEQLYNTPNRTHRLGCIKAAVAKVSISQLRRY